MSISKLEYWDRYHEDPNEPDGPPRQCGHECIRCGGACDHDVDAGMKCEIEEQMEPEICPACVEETELCRDSCPAKRDPKLEHPPGCGFWN
jgi:hypothetical protein